MRFLPGATRWVPDWIHTTGLGRLDPQLTVRPAVAVCESDPFRPRTVSVELLALARFELILSVAVQPDPALAEAGENDALTRLGRPLTLNETVPEKPFTGVIVTV